MNEDEYSCAMPELFADLGEIYRLHVKDRVKAAECYLAACNIGFMPYLAESRGVALANHGIGLLWAEEAMKLKADPDPQKWERMGAKAAFRLRAYQGFYKDEDAPDHAKIMALLKEIDPRLIRRTEEERKEAARQAEEMKKHQEYKKKAKESLEY